MPANLKDLRNRIKSVKSTQQITKAMKLVSAAKFGRAQHALINSRPYAHSLALLIYKLVRQENHEESIHPLIRGSTSKHALVIVLSSERGLCGGYNANVTKQALKTIFELESQGMTVKTVCIGKKALQALARKRKLIQKTTESPLLISEHDYSENPNKLISHTGLAAISTHFDKPNHAMATRLSEAINTLYSQEKIGKLIIVHHKFYSAISQTPCAETVLPFHIKAASVEAEPLFEPELDELLHQVLPRYLSSRIFQTLLEATASEHGARMTAMDNATRNAKEMEQKLQITYQRARQAAITKELIEIISGAEAL